MKPPISGDPSIVIRPRPEIRLADEVRVRMFVDSDAWVLLALIVAREPADRDRLRFVGDYLNRAIFTDDELEGGLTRLLRAGYAVDHGGRFAPGPPVLAWYRASTDFHADLRRVSTFLGIRDDD